jgi:hypothetical protein
MSGGKELDAAERLARSRQSYPFVARNVEVGFSISNLIGMAQRWQQLKIPTVDPTVLLEKSTAENDKPGPWIQRGTAMKISSSRVPDVPALELSTMKASPPHPIATARKWRVLNQESEIDEQLGSLRDRAKARKHVVVHQKGTDTKLPELVTQRKGSAQGTRGSKQGNPVRRLMSQGDQSMGRSSPGLGGWDSMNSIASPIKPLGPTLEYQSGMKRKFSGDLDAVKGANR